MSKVKVPKEIERVYCNFIMKGDNVWQDRCMLKARDSMFGGVHGGCDGDLCILHIIYSACLKGKEAK